ncbi:MAG: zinc metallopeptidase, partial [Clostridia bacterium]|nr:zinc metallopeptidase [Clostridia bacterium]
VELDASRRAMSVIRDTNLLYSEEENRGAQKVLKSAAMTYVAALAVSMANLLRFIIMFTGRGRK